MERQIKNCQNCKQNFSIEPEDFQFYEKIQVPAPTWCPQCRMIRRFMFRNERTWYKRTCDATGKNILAMIAPDKGYTVYEQSYWKSDAWDPLSYGRDIDFTKPFFNQFGGLFKAIPHPNLIQKNVVGSDYSNYTLNLKNCYYCVSGDTGEDNAYLFTYMLRIRQCIDGYFSTDSEHSYEIVDCTKVNGVRFCQLCEACVDSWFLYDCRNCTNCVGCVGLRSKQYCIWNKQYTKEEYQQELAKLNLGSYQGLQAVKAKFETLKMNIPRKFAAIIKSENAIGDDIQNSRNVQGFAIRLDAENVRYGYRVVESRDIWDGFITWNGAEMEYEVMSCSAQRTICSALIWGGFDIQYSYNCFDCNNIFGCIGLRNKSYCILNKQYSKEEYEQLIPKIIAHMKKNPYEDKRGVAYGYGEFFPFDISPFVYNETIAQDYFPSTKEQVATFGYGWRDEAARSYGITVKNSDIPDSVTEASDGILNDVIGCMHEGKNCREQCAGAFRLIPSELQFYRQMGIPLPRLCPSCRHFQRVKQKPPLMLFSGSCGCSGKNSRNGAFQNTSAHFHGNEPCPNTFQTPYDNNYPGIIYCEACYNAEIV